MALGGIPVLFHVPETAQGAFTGDPSFFLGAIDLQTRIILDDGSSYNLLEESRVTEAWAVDHDERAVITQRETAAQGVDTTALLDGVLYVGHTRAIREETQRRRGGNWDVLGQEINVRERSLSNTFEFYDDLLHFDGKHSRRTVATKNQDVKVYDFDWEIELVDRMYDYHYKYQTIPSPNGSKYRLIYLGRYGLEKGYMTVEYYQAHITNYPMDGLVEVGFCTPAISEGKDMTPYQYEVTAVLGYEYANGRIWRTYCNVWTYFIKRTTYNPNYPVPQTETEWGDSPHAPLYGLDGAQVGWYSRVAPEDAHKKVLRDIVVDDLPATPVPTGPRFKALGGAVVVWGQRNLRQANLTDETLMTTGHTLTAWGHTFVGGSMAALRDLPRRKKDGTLDFDTTIILHASKTTVTAIRPDGSTESCSLAEFETRVLRVPVGSFVGFNTVGAFSHSWPPERAWANCEADTRAIIAHDPWRDSYKRLPRDSPNTREWYWAGRPPKRPKNLPRAAPRGLLGLTLADVTTMVTCDEQLKKGEGPLRQPLRATQTRADGTVVDVTRKVAKRLPYSPAHIPDERDDTTSVSNTITLTFGPLPALPGGA